MPEIDFEKANAQKSQSEIFLKSTLMMQSMVRRYRARKLVEAKRNEMSE